MKHFFLIFLIFNTFLSFCQIDENFNDGEITTNPTWTGSISNYSINSSLQLQSNNTLAATTFITSNHNLQDIDEKEWHFWIKLAFSPSANNFAKVYLTANNSDLSVHPDGYYLQFGETGSLDAIRLFKEENAISTEICSGNVGQIATSFALSVKIIRAATGDWKLFVDPAGGEQYLLQASANDPSNLVGSYFGIQTTYTVSNANKFYFDNVYVGPKIVDLTPPQIVSASAINQTQVDILFNEPLDPIAVQTTSNYSFSPSNAVSNAQIDGSNSSLIHLLLTNSLQNGTTYTVTTNGIADVSGNPENNQQTNFSYYVSEIPVYGDLIITEFMADPSPIVGLPEVEFVEIYNKSQKYFNLNGWKIGDASGNGTIQSAWIGPGEYKILCASSSLTDYPTGLSVSSFPSLNNSGDIIKILNNTGLLIDSLNYTDAWYKDEVKKEGGYSLERIQLNDPCSKEDNWKASTNSTGGTPEFVNAVNDTLPDSQKPDLFSIVPLNATAIQITFSEGMDSTTLMNSVLSFSPTLSISQSSVAEYYSNSFSVYTTTAILPSTLYTVQINNVADCWGNQTNLTGHFALPEIAVKGDLIINEILFDPLTDGSDFIEIYNNSSKIINLHTIQIANYANDSISNSKVINSPFLIGKGEYVAITKDTSFLQSHYAATVSGRLIQNDLPSYNIDSSTVYLLSNNEVIDRVAYSSNWHFSLLEDVKGKSLERISFTSISNDSTNWHTAAETIGFATPGEKNSNYLESISAATFDFTNKIISPDNDGYEDNLLINYKVEETNLIGTLTIYDEQGRVVRKLVKNELLATKGNFIWDGIKDDQTKANLGTHIAVFEVFDLKGKIIYTKRKAFVVAGKI
ncbi:MAG: lamin tail domain-containing protein [Flavobacteriia bacterium]|nr:lamin tail domain-containing protein [Flavobacteriia bacterium]